MTNFLYLIFIVPISSLPLKFLYYVSDVFRYVVQYVIRYRVNVVRQNLKNSFPNRTKKELSEIEVGFYRFFTDFIFENLKSFSQNADQILKRYEIGDTSIFERYKDRNICLITGHYGNWENIAVILNKVLKHQVVCIYSPLKDRYINKLMFNNRSKTGMELVPKNEVPTFLNFGFSKKKKALVFAADQSPTYSRKVVWTKFLNQSTAVFRGPEVIAKKKDMVVIYLRVQQLERGRYSLNFLLIEENPNKSKKNEITCKHTRLLEQDIKNNPFCWLWSHKRWKLKKN
ncbi:lysophospholipid acyltransferase family protein (plasmid) [Flammeovirga sp. MY04]|uniref:lysophospholipid acyltransferase family protein n=1 Tax=Flammeovirga sp. MY04 TaxID=1191459 RepID=UPI000806394A|nr:lysophospholipid acyltransferase family protein [Flammeovirga sp. MY04]ANQ52880.1 lysophospholipid acyltransferase family protein [Flammeovirga sp. MY04]